jgi:threonyl-tRNA synthetase
MHERGDRRHEQQRQHDREVLHAVSLTAPVDMLSAMRIGLPDGTDLELENGATGLDVANAIGPRLAQAAVAVGVGDEVRDLRLPLAEGDRVRILTSRDAEALPVLRHSTAHVMAEAVLHLWPDAKVAIGPAIADGFYYDFQFPEPISSDDLGRIEQEMRRILAQEHPFVRPTA